MSRQNTLYKEYNNFDIVDLAIKHKLIGSFLFVEKENKYLKVTNYYLDFATREIHIVFKGNTRAVIFSFSKKFKVKVRGYRSINKSFRLKF